MAEHRKSKEGGRYSKANQTIGLDQLVPSCRRGSGSSWRKQVLQVEIEK